MPIYQRLPTRSSRGPVAPIQRRKAPWGPVTPAPAASLDPEAIERAARFGHQLPFGRTASGEERESSLDVPRMLPSPFRRKMERSFGEDLSDVQIREGATAPRADAIAFTRGRSIHFSPGAFQPHSEAGQRLLAHEIAHVVQQRRGRVRATHQHGELSLNADPALESQADQAGDRALRGHPAFGRGAPARTAPPAAGAPVAQGILGYLAAAGLGLAGAYYAAKGVKSVYDWGKKKVQDYQRFRALRTNIQGTNPELADRFSHIGTMDEAEWMADLAPRDPDLADPRGQAVARPGHAQLGFDPELHIPLPNNPAVNAPKLHALATGGYPKVQQAGSTLHVGYNQNQLNEMHTGVLGEMYGAVPPLINQQNNYDLQPAIEGAFGNREAGRRRQQGRFDLLRESYQRTNEFDYNAFDNQFDKREVRRLGKVANKQNPGNYLLNTRGYEGFTIGEGHGDSASKGYLIQNMGSLSQSGVNTLYLEHIRSEYQDAIDQYLASPAHAPVMPPELQRMITANDTAHNLANQAQGHNLMGVLTAAKQHNMRVRSIDSMDAQSDVQGPDSDDLRAITMNVFGENAVRGDANARGGGKYVMLAGSAHNNTHARNNNVPQGFQQGLPGFSQLLDIPAVTVDPQSGRLILDRENKGNRA